MPIFDPGIFDPGIFDAGESVAPNARSGVRLEIWTSIACDGGVRKCFVKDRTTLVGTFSLEGEESLTFTLPLTSRAAEHIREGRVARVWFPDESFDEWWIATIVKRRDKGGSSTVTCRPVITKLGQASPVREPANTQLTPALDIGVTQLTPEEIIQTWLLDNPGVAAELPWLTLGTIEPEVLIDVEWSSASPLAVLRAICEAVEATGEPCELRLRRVDSDSYAIDLLHEIGSDAERPHIRFRRNLQSLEVTIDPTDRATRIEALLASLGGSSTYLGAARWVITAIDDTDPEAVIVTLADPAGGAGPIAFDDQTVGWFAFRERTGGTYEVLDADAAAQTITLPRASTLAVGEYLSFRTSEPLTGSTPIGPSPNVGSAIGTAIQPLQIESIAGDVFTVVESGAVTPMTRDGQYVDAVATFAAFVAAPTVIGSTGDALASHVIALDSVADIAVDDLAYECLSTGAPHAFNAGKKLRVTAIDTDEVTVTVELYDTPGVLFTRLLTAGSLYVARPQPGSALVVGSDAGARELTLVLDEDAEDWAVPDDVGLLFLTLATGQGEEPYYLDHPVYAASPSEDGDGIGVKFGTIDRGDIIGVANLLPNPVLRDWPDPDAPPTGWTTRENAAGATTIAQNTDEAFTLLGGKSLQFRLTNGGFPDRLEFGGYNAIISPPIPWTAVRAGERFSVRVALLLEKWSTAIGGEWSGDIALEAKLGVLLADGTVKTWDWPDATAMMVPEDAEDPVLSRGTKTTGGQWVAAVLNGFDITSEGGSQRVSAGDIAAAVGYVVVLAQAKGTIEGYLDAAMVTLSDEAPQTISEFGGANAAWQTTNLAVAQLAPPQASYAVDVVDLKRLNPSISERSWTLGGTTYVTDLGLALRAITQRVVEMVINYLVEGDVKVVLASRARKLTDLLIKARVRAERNLAARIRALEQVTRSSGTARPPSSGGSGGSSSPISWLDWFGFLRTWDFDTGTHTRGATDLASVESFCDWSIPGSPTVTGDYTTVNGRPFAKVSAIGTSSVYFGVFSHQDFSLNSFTNIPLGSQLRLSIPVKAVAGVDGYFWTRGFATNEDGVHPSRYLWEVKVTIAAGVVTATATTGAVLSVVANPNGEYVITILATEGNTYPLNDEQEIILIDGPAYDGSSGLAAGSPGGFVLDPGRAVSAIDSVLIGPVDLYSYVPGTTNVARADEGPDAFGTYGLFDTVGDEYDVVVDWYDRDYWFDVAPELRRNSPLGAWHSSNPAVVTVDPLTGHLEAVGAGSANIYWDVTTPSGTVTSNSLPFTIS